MCSNDAFFKNILAESKIQVQESQSCEETNGEKVHEEADIGCVKSDAEAGEEFNGLSA